MHTRNLNYQHLYYFWRVAAAGSVSEAAKELRLAQPTVSAQLKTLEESLGESLLHRQGRSLSLTEAGKIAYRYAGEIFSLGKDFVDTLHGENEVGLSVLQIGIADVLPKLLTYKLLQPVLEDGSYRVIVHENRPERLLAELSIRHLDMLLLDTPHSTTLSDKTESQFLGDCGISFFATKEMAKKIKKNFPYSLDGAPFVLPTENSNLRRSLDHWFIQNELRPKVVAELEDSALIRLFAKRGVGVFAAPSAIEQEIIQETGMHLIGREDQIREGFYAITIGSHSGNKAVRTLVEHARLSLFSQ